MSRARQLFLRDSRSREFKPGVEGGGGGDFYVGRDAGLGPVVGGIWIDGFDFGDANAEVIVEAVENAGMGGSGGCFSDERGALEHFEVVRELFGAGSSARGSQDEDGFVSKFTAGNGRARPGLLGRVFARVVPILGVIKKIGADELNHFGRAAAIVAKIEDDGVSVVNVRHGGHGGDTADFGIGKGIEFEVADVTGQELDFFERAILLLHGFAILRRNCGGLRGRLRRQRLLEIIECEMTVGSNFAHLLGHERGEGGRIRDGVVMAAFFVCRERIGHFLRGVVIKVMFLEICNRVIHDTFALRGNKRAGSS